MNSSSRRPPVRALLVGIACGLLCAVDSVAAGSAPAAPAAPVADPATISWLEANGHAFSSETPPAPQFAPLLARLDGARVIGVGEVTHGSHEDQAFKAELIKALILDHRIDVLVLEMNRQVGVDLDAYVTAGTGDLPTILRSPGFFRTWRDDEFAGLVLWMRAYNVQSERPVRIIGIDVQDPGSDASVALRFLRSHDLAAAARLAPGFVGLLPSASTRRFAVWETAASPVEYARATAAADELLKVLERHRASWGAGAGYDDAVEAATTARQAFDSFERDGGRGDVEKDGMEYFGRRDRYMASNLLGRLRGRTAAFWAHDLHVIADVPADNGWPAGYTWVGREVHAVLGPAYVTVTFAWTDGQFRAQLQTGTADSEVLNRRPMTPQTLPNDLPGDLGEVLGHLTADRSWFDLRTLPANEAAGAFGSTVYPRGWAGWGIDAKTWNRDDSDRSALRPGTDILVWFRTLTPSHLLPGDDF